MTTNRFTSFDQFWPYYLQEHAKPLTRGLHYIGTSLVVMLAVAAVLSGNAWLALAMPVAGYFFAWMSHWRVERNRPATFTYPLWSLIADFKMWWLWLTRKLEPELKRAGVSTS